MPLMREQARRSRLWSASIGRARTSGAEQSSDCPARPSTSSRPAPPATPGSTASAYAALQPAMTASTPNSIAVSTMTATSARSRASESIAPSENPAGVHGESLKASGATAMTAHHSRPGRAAAGRWRRPRPADATGVNSAPTAPEQAHQVEHRAPSLAEGHRDQRVGAHVDGRATARQQREAEGGAALSQRPGQARGIQSRARRSRPQSARSGPNRSTRLPARAVQNS